MSWKKLVTGTITLAKDKSLVLELRKYPRKELADLRVWVRGADGKLYPSKSGFSFPPPTIPVLKKELTKMERAFKSDQITKANKRYKRWSKK